MENYVNHYLDLQEVNQQNKTAPNAGQDAVNQGSDRSARNSKFSSAFRKGGGGTDTRDSIQFNLNMQFHSTLHNKTMQQL